MAQHTNLFGDVRSVIFLKIPSLRNFFVFGQELKIPKIKFAPQILKRISNLLLKYKFLNIGNFQIRKFKRSQLVYFLLLTMWFLQKMIQNIEAKPIGYDDKTKKKNNFLVLEFHFECFDFAAFFCFRVLSTSISLVLV